MEACLKRLLPKQECWIQEVLRADGRGSLKGAGPPLSWLCFSLWYFGTSPEADVPFVLNLGFSDISGVYRVPCLFFLGGGSL